MNKVQSAREDWGPVDGAGRMGGVPRPSAAVLASGLEPQPAANPRCSVVIVSYRTGPILIECLRSVLRQDGLAEVVLVDNGNDAALRSRIAQLAEEDARLVRLAGHGNVGFARGCNLGARRASGDFLLLLNPDSILPRGTLRRCMQVFADRPDAAMITVRINNPDGSEQRGGRRNLLTPWISLVECLRLDRLAPHHPHFKRLNLNETAPLTGITPVKCISGAFMFMPRRVFDEYGGLDEAYFLHVEDIDFCMKIAKRGGTILYVPDIAVAHQKSTSRAFPPVIEWHKSVSAVRYFRKHFRPDYPTFLLNAIAVAVMLRWLVRLPPLTFAWLMERIHGNAPAGPELTLAAVDAAMPDDEATAEATLDRRLERPAIKRAV